MEKEYFGGNYMNLKSPNFIYRIQEMRKPQLYLLAFARQAHKPRREEEESHAVALIQ